MDVDELDRLLKKLSERIPRQDSVMKVTRLTLVVITFLSSIYLAHAISYPCSGNAICANDVTLYEIWQTLGNITDNYTQFIYFPSNNTFIANATFLGNNIVINDTTVKNFRKWIGSREPANHLYVRNVTMYGAPDDLGHYTYLYNVTIYGTGKDEDTSYIVVGGAENVEIHNTTLTVVNFGTTKNLTFYNSNVTTKHGSTLAGDCNGYNAYNTTFVNSVVDYSKDDCNMIVNFANIQDVTYLNSSVILPLRGTIISGAYSENSTFDATNTESTVLLKDSVLQGNFTFGPNTKHLYENVSVISSNECSISINLSDYPYSFGLDTPFKLKSTTDYETPDICVIDYGDSIIYMTFKNLEIFGNVTVVGLTKKDMRSCFSFSNTIIHGKLYLKTKYRWDFRVSDHTSSLMFGKILVDDGCSFVEPAFIGTSSTSVHVFMCPNYGTLKDWNYAYVTQYHNIKLYRLLGEYSPRLVDYSHEGDYYNFTFRSGVSPPLPLPPIKIVLENQNPHQIADVYYDTGNGEIKELGRFYGDENGTLEILYDRGADPVAKVFVKLDGTGLPPPETPPPALPTTTTTITTITTTATPPVIVPIFPPEQPSLLDFLTSIHGVLIIVFILAAGILLIYVKYLKK